MTPRCVKMTKLAHTLLAKKAITRERFLAVCVENPVRNLKARQHAV
jgi:hypothetical protein